jgi:cell division protein FtsX
MTTKQTMLEAIEQLPDDASVDDAMERLYLLAAIERGLEQVADVRVVSQEEAMRRFQPWLESVGRRRRLNNWNSIVGSSPAIPRDTRG